MFYYYSHFTVKNLVEDDPFYQVSRGKKTLGLWKRRLFHFLFLFARLVYFNWESCKT